MKIEKSKLNDVEKIMKIFLEAQEYMKEKNIDQWQNNYPNTNKIQEDIKNNEGYVLKEGNEIIGTFVMSLTKELSYENYANSWINNNDYSVIHRLAISNKYKGKNLALEVLKFVKEKSKEKKISSIKIDTHRDNYSMRKFLEKNGFVNCGIIIIYDGSERIAYQLQF